MEIIKLKNIRIHTNHGCLEEEKLIGSDYVVNIEVRANLKGSMVSDDLQDTIDYVSINNIVKKEMKKRSKLLEHVCSRILDELFSKYENVLMAKVEVAKINPPIGGDMDSVALIVERSKVSKE